MMRKKIFLLLGVLPFLFSGPVLADKPAPVTADKPVSAAMDKFSSGTRAFDAGQYDRARELWLPLAENGDIRAQYAIGRLFEKGHGVDRNLETAINWYRKAAEHGHPDSEYRISVGYAYGLGLQRDETEALIWLRRAANHGQKRAQKALAQAYEAGRLGLNADPKQAKYWYDKANSGL